MYSPTPYKVSTITATGSVNSHINLDILFNNVDVSADRQESQDCGIVYVEYGNKKTDTVQKGYLKKPMHEYENGRKRFDNQVTIVYRCRVDKYNEPITVNSKVFKNGNIQMTGLRYVDQGRDVIDYIINIIKTIHTKKDADIVEDPLQLENVNYKICLINCDFRTGIEFNRDILFTTLQENYETIVSYEPCIYPAVKIQYWYNEDCHQQDGACYCDKKCNGKGCGRGVGNCKKITIAVFQSGCIIITGGQTFPQIQRAYEFICSCLSTHLKLVQKKHLPLPPSEIKKKKVYIKKSDIRHA
jgi:TATA-box binding protein (TBP) (component of TFIID and TFIIIB)